MEYSFGTGQFLNSTYSLMEVQLSLPPVIGTVRNTSPHQPNFRLATPQERHYFQMMGAFFALLRLKSEKIALMVNMMSVFASAFTILFLFLDYYNNLVKKLPVSKTILFQIHAIIILGCCTDWIIMLLLFLIAFGLML